MHSFKYLCHFCRTSEEHFSQRFQIYILYSHFDLAKYISTTIPAFREFEFNSRVLDWSALKKFCQVGKKDVLTQCPAFCAIFISAKSMFGFPCPPSSENADDEFVLKRLTTLLHLPPFSTLLHLPPAKYSICPAVAIHIWERTHCSRFDFNFASPARSCQSSQKKTRRNQYFSISVLTLTQSWLILRNCNSIVSYYIQSQENCEISFHQVLRCE